MALIILLIVAFCVSVLGALVAIKAADPNDK